jgi:hypothetical protein
MPKRSNRIIKIGLLLLPLFFPFSRVLAQNMDSLKKQSPFKNSGNISAEMDSYNLLSGANPGYLNPLSWSLNGNVMMSIYGINIPVSALLSNQSTAFNSPFSRFGISPAYKWAALHLGWQSLNFSQFTLGGQNIFGAGVSLTPGKFHFDFMYGKFDSAITDISVFNNLNSSNIPVYSRKGFATQIGYGNEKNNFYINYLSAKDDSNSISTALKNKSQMLAASNQVIGLKSKISFLKYAYWYVDAAASFYIRDQSVDTVKKTNQWWNFLASSPNSSTQFLTALETGFQINTSSLGLGLKYRRVDPDYKSMGAFYLQTDIQQYTINPSVKLMKNTLVLTGSLGIQNDNLFKNNANSSQRTIGLLNVSYNPGQTFGIDVQYSNFGISQQLLTKYVNPNPNKPLYDSVRINQVSRSITLSPHLSFIGTKYVNIITASFSFQNLDDKNPNTSTTNNFNSTLAVVTHSINFLQSKWLATQSITYFDTKLSAGDVSDLGYTLGVSKNIERKKLTINANASYYFNSLAGHQIGNTVRITGGAGFVVFKNQSLQAGVGLIATNNKASGSALANNSSQLTTYLRYNVSF